MTTAPRPGWYPDPAGAVDLYRWWNGETWTDAISESAQAPRPGSVPTGSTDSRSEVVGPGEPQDRAEAGDPHVDYPRRRSPWRIVVVLVCGFALFLAAALGVGLMIWREPGSAGTSAAPPRVGSPSTALSSSPGGPQAPAGQLDESTGIATIGQASLTLPGSPYELYDDPMQLTGVFDAFFVANAEVHADYDGSHGWSATVGLAHFSPTLTMSEDLSKAGAEAMAQLSKRFFAGHSTTLKEVSSSERAVDGHSGVLLTAQVHYAIAGLPSTYDTVTAWLVRLDDGSLVVAISSVPNDASDEVHSLAEQSLESLTIS